MSPMVDGCPEGELTISLWSKPLSKQPVKGSRGTKCPLVGSTGEAPGRGMQRGLEASLAKVRGHTAHTLRAVEIQKLNVAMS